MTPEELQLFIDAHPSDVIDISDLSQTASRVTGYPLTDVMGVIYSGRWLVGQTTLFRKEGSNLNPFTMLQQKLQHARSGDVAAEGLYLLCPHWAAEWSDTGKLPVTDVMAKLDELPQGRLVKGMKRLVSGLKGLN